MRMNRVINKNVLFLLLLVWSLASPFFIKAQDIHFSQFYFSPLVINPANTGVFSGNYRFSSNYKNQWRTIGNSYKTALASFDMSLAKKRLGAGLTFFNDKAGKTEMSSTNVNGSVAYNVKVNDQNNIIAGMQFGYGQRSVDVSNLKWDSQFNGTLYDAALPTGEAQYSQAYSYLDVAAGLMWNYSAKLTPFKSSTGMALFHVNQPKQSFFMPDKLYAKWVIHHSSQFKLADEPIYILPQFLFLKQGPHSEINIGALCRYVITLNGSFFRDKNRIDIGAKKEDKMESKNAIAVFGGAQLRYKDALIAIVGCELKKSLLISFCYDVNVSKLRKASNTRGGAELALTYKGSF